MIPCLKRQARHTLSELYNRNYRKYSIEISWIVRAYLLVVAFVVILSATSIPWFHSKISFNLSDKVLITLLTTTSVNILGLMYIVAKHLFPSSAK